MSTENIILTIAIPTYNRAAFLDELLVGLRGHSQLAEALAGEFEVLVVDNASTDTTPDVCARHLPSLACGRIIRQKVNVGFPGNLRTAFSAARGRHVWILCDDDLADNIIIKKILCALRVYPGAAALLLNRDIYDVSMTRLLQANSLGSRLTAVHESWDGKLRYAGSLLTASCVVLYRAKAERGFNHPSFAGTCCETMVLALHALQGGDLVVLGGATIRYREGNNGSWNALWPWIYFHNIPMVVHDVLDAAGEWTYAQSFVAGRKNYIMFSLCYLMTSPITRIKKGYRIDDLKLIYGNTRVRSAAFFVISHTPKIFLRGAVISMMGLRLLFRQISEIRSASTLFRVPFVMFEKLKKFFQKERV